MLEELRDSGPRPEAGAEKCMYIAPKASKAKFCFRHGGVEPRLVRAGDGTCPVRARLFIPTSTAAVSLQVIVVLRGTHKHVFPVLKPLSTVVARVVSENASKRMRALQVRCNTHSRGGGGAMQTMLYVCTRNLRRRS